MMRRIKQKKQEQLESSLNYSKTKIQTKGIEAAASQSERSRVESDFEDVDKRSQASS